MSFSWRLSALVFALLTAWLALPALGGTMAFVWHDAVFSEVAIHHLQQAILRGGDWRALPLAWPLPDPATQTDWMVGQAIVGLPLALLGVEPLRAYVALCMLGLFTSAMACDRVAAALLGEGVHTWAAGLVGGFAPAQILHAPHANLVWHAFGPLAALLLVAGLSRDRPAICALAGVLASLGFHFGVYVGMHAALVFAVAVPFAAWFARGTPRGWAGVAVGVAVGLATLLPVARVYLGAATGARIDLPELARESIDFGQPRGPFDDPLLHGPAPVVLAAIGLWAKRRGGWPWALAATVALAAFLLAMGPYVQWHRRPVAGPAPWGVLVELVPPLASLRAPARWLTVLALALSPFAAAGVARLTRTSRVLGGMAVLAIVHDMPRPFFGPVAHATPDAAYAMLVATDVPGPVLDFVRAGCRDRGPASLRAVLDHGHPVVGGQYAREVDALEDANRRAAAWPSDATVAWLRDVGVRLVFDHPPLPPAPPGATCETSNGHRLCVLGP